MIFKRLMVLFSVIMVTVFIIIGTLLFSLTGSYVLSEKRETLYKIGSRVSDVSGKMLSEDYEEYSMLLNISFELLSSNSDCEVIMADKEGKVLLRTFNKFPNDSITEMPDLLVSAIMNGESADIAGDLVGISRKALAVAVPVMYNEEVVAGVYLITNIPDLEALRTDILKMYFISFIISLAAAAILAFTFYKRITAPINEVKKAAEAFSKGQLDTRVNIVGHDEMAILAEAFNDMADSLTQIEKMRRSFVSDVSHELRTPMTTITGFIQGILDGTIPEEKKELYLKIVLDETKRLSKLVSDLLESSRINSDDVALEKSKFDINEQIRITLIGFDERLDEKNINVNISFANDREFVFADKDSIKRVLTNLIDNAIKFSFEGGNLDIATEDAGEKVLIRVRNEGEGVPEESRKHIFERFYKNDKSRSMNKNGVGLGLYIVKSIVNKHGEKITLVSEEGSFAEFQFTLTKYRIN